MGVEYAGGDQDYQEVHNLDHAESQEHAQGHISPGVLNFFSHAGDFSQTAVRNKDQCRRGYGYPVVLSEAHERAVVNAADRELFRRLVETALTERRLPASTSAKSWSKRARWI